MSNPFEDKTLEAELQDKAGTQMPGNFGQTDTGDSFTEIDPSILMQSSLGDHQQIIGKIEDAQKRAEASKDYMSESKLTFGKFISQKKIQAVNLDEEIAKLATPVDGEDYLKNLERVLNENSSRTKVSDALRAVAVIRAKITEGNELKRTLKKASVAKVRKFADELDKQPHEPVKKAATAEEQTTEMIHFASQEMLKIGAKFKALQTELANLKDKVISTHNAQGSLIEYLKKTDVAVSSQIMPEVYRRHKYNHQRRDFHKYWAKWNERETKLQTQFAQKFPFDNVLAVFGQMLIDAEQYDCSTEISRDDEYIEHRKMWDAFLAQQEQYYLTWGEEYTKIKTETNFAFIQRQSLELDARLKRVTEERDIANATVVEKVNTIATLEQQIREQIETFANTKNSLDTQKASAEQLIEEVRRLNGLNTTQATLIRNLTEERDNLKKQVEKDKIDFAGQLADSKRTYETTIAELQKKHSFAEEEKSTQFELNLTLNQTKKDLEEKLKNLEKELQAREAQIELMKGNMALLEADLKKSRDEFQALTNKFEINALAYEKLKQKYSGD